MLIILCGPSFCGKSTLSRRLKTEFNFKVVSLDEINDRRGLWGGDGIPQEEWGKSHQMALTETAEALENGFDVVIDDTNCMRFLRDDYRNIAAGKRCVSQVWVINPPESVLQQRRADNEKTGHRKGITDEIFRAHLDSFEWPKDDENPVAMKYDELLSLPLNTLLGL